MDTRIPEDSILQMIKDFEGFRANAYPDPGTGRDPWTIGYGHTKGVYPGLVITEEQAEQYLLEDLQDAQACLEHAFAEHESLHDFRYWAIVSFIFNVGCGAFKTSTMLKHLKNGDMVRAGNEFERWVYAGGQVLPGLETRRKEEKNLFFSAPDYGC
jgi:lysozyme